MVHPSDTASTSFTNDTDVESSRYVGKSDEMAESDPGNMFQRTGTNLSDEDSEENAGVPLNGEESSRRASLEEININHQNSDLDTPAGLSDPVQQRETVDPLLVSQEVSFPAAEEHDHTGPSPVGFPPRQSTDQSGQVSHFAAELAMTNEPTNDVFSAHNSQHVQLNDDVLSFHATTDGPGATNPGFSLDSPSITLIGNEIPLVPSFPATPGPTQHHDFYEYYDSDGGYDDDAHDSNLIEPADLLGFNDDRLDLTLPRDLSNEDDDLSGVVADAEKFYASEDEFSFGEVIEDDMDIDESYGDQLTLQPRIADLPFSSADRPYRENFSTPEGDAELEDEGNDDELHDQEAQQISEDSMETNFLEPTLPNPPSHPNTPPQDMHVLPQSSEHPKSGPEILSSSPKSLSSPPSQPRTPNVFGEFSISSGPSTAADTHHAVSTPVPASVSLSSYRGFGSSDDFQEPGSSTSTSPHRMRIFDLESSLPVDPLESTASYIPFSGHYMDEPESTSVRASAMRTGFQEHSPSSFLNRPLLSEEEYEDIHRPCEGSPYFVEPEMILDSFDPPIASSLLATPLAPSEEDEYNNANGITLPALERNLTVSQFIRQWFFRSRLPPSQLGMEDQFRPISVEAAHVSDWSRPSKISRPDGPCYKNFDIQGIPWGRVLKVTRADARSIRDHLYKSYHNLKYEPHGYSATLSQAENYFRPKAMYTKYKASMEHFQLRNLMSVTASNTLQYAKRSKVHSVTPFYDERRCVLDFSNPPSSSLFLDPIRITTMQAKHGVTVIGGFGGEYAYTADINDCSIMEGFVTKEFDGITTHVDVTRQRTTGTPQAVISSNDANIRILDCLTNTYVRQHKFAAPINCTDTSPDGRLRVIVGDAPDAWIVDADTGKPTEVLSGHRDFGFACAWSPDMLHIATANQDKTVNVWDARMWRILSTVDADVACYRSLRFSPVGGGPRTLLMSEPADRVSVVNAQTYRTRQVLDFFGEIGGADYSPDGGRIWVANMDPQFGGLIEFDRRQWGQEFGIGHTRRRLIESEGDMYYPDLPNEWLRERDLSDDERCILGAGERKLRYQRLLDKKDYEETHPFLG